MGKNNKKRSSRKWLAALLVLIMAGGGMAAGSVQAAETAAESQTGKTIDESVLLLMGSAKAADREKNATGETALSIMGTVNTAQAQIMDDNYRSWYEVFVYSFYDSDGDGIGDLNGLTQMLDYINDGDDSTDTDLGCNGIWLMPVMPSTTYHKYDVTDYCSIDPEYGTLEDFQVFLEECHERGIRVILDLVLNHTSSQHPWFTEACEYLQSLEEGEEPDPQECPCVEYYNFYHERKSNCYQIDGTDWYYEAPFWSEMPDLNLSSPAVRQEIRKIVEFWMDMGVDGFRLDAVKDYYSGNVEANVEMLSWLNTVVEELNPDAYLVAEVWTDLATYAGYYASGIESCFDFAFADSDGIIARSLKKLSGATASTYGNAVMSLQEMLSQYSGTYIDAPFYTNHDMGRSAGYYAGEYSENQTKLAQAMNLMMTGSAFLYYGEELGMKGSGADENKRAPMYWSADPEAEGMCSGPEAMDSFSMKFGSLEEQAEDGDSVYSFVKQVLKLRNAYPAIARGTAVFEEAVSDDNICVLRKTYEGDDGTQEIILVFNLSEEAQSADLSGMIPQTAQISEFRLGGALVTSAEEIVWDGTELMLPLYSAAVLIP